jgi:hypothetical protein
MKSSQTFYYWEEAYFRGFAMGKPVSVPKLRLGGPRFHVTLRAAAYKMSEENVC